MIFDTIANSKRYFGLFTGIERVLAAVSAYAPDCFSAGRVPIDSENVYMNLAEYDTHEKEDGMMEAHKQYIDVMYMVDGIETVYIKPTDSLQRISKEYDPAMDALLAEIDCDAGAIRLEAGSFLVLFPGEAHAPACDAEGPAHVKKIIGKVRIA